MNKKKKINGKPEIDFAWKAVYYRAAKPNAVLSPEGKAVFEKIKIYNATNKDVPTSVSIKGKLYSLIVSIPPEPFTVDDLKNGQKAFFPLSAEQVEKFAQEELAANRSKLIGRPQRRKFLLNRRKYYSSITVVSDVIIPEDANS